MQYEMQRWFKRDGERFLIGIGLRPDDMVLDFGCGDGVYSIPAAKLVGTGGIVYALDRDRHSLRSVMEKAAAFGTYNIVTVIDLIELRRLLHGNLIDAVLLYDVIHSYYFTHKERVRLLMEISPMVPSGGLISIFPRHMDHDEIHTVTMELEKLGFLLLGENSTNLMHDGMYTRGYTIQFKKMKGIHDAENKTV
jgi:cyclopropane fatty-acyl-phospholipid synthase-like methyltransferase